MGKKVVPQDSGEPDEDDEFTKEVLLPCVQAGLFRENGAWLGVWAAQPLTAKRLGSLIRREGEAKIRYCAHSGQSLPETGAGEYVMIAFEAGVPTAINGKKMKPADIIRTLDMLGTRCGIGRSDIGANCDCSPAFGEYELPPGIIILAEAYEQLAMIVLDREMTETKKVMAKRLWKMLSEGKWFSKECDEVRASVASMQSSVTGKVKLKLYRGNIIKFGSSSPYELPDVPRTEAAKARKVSLPADPAAAKKELDRQLDRIMKDILTEGMSQKDKAWAIFSYIREHVDYVNTSEKGDYVRSALQAILQGQGDCYSYFSVAKAMLTFAGIKNMDIERIPEGDKLHYWNLVDLEDGHGWYHYDTTPRIDHPTIFLWDDATIKAYSDARYNCHNYDRAKYPRIL
jgi:hypothetical protein